MIARWRRPSRIPRKPRLVLAALLGAGALVLWLQAPAAPAASPMVNHHRIKQPGAAAHITQGPFPPGKGASTVPTPTSPALVALGHRLFDQRCASCHGLQLQGRKHIAPSLIGVGAGPVHFYLSTGRMPLADYHVEPLREAPAFDPRRIKAIVAYVVHAGGGPASPVAYPSKGSLSVGFKQFDLHCAGCHQIVARGGMTVGALVPNLQLATPLQIAEAVRMGPYLMPRFDHNLIDQYQLNSLAKYILWTRHPSNFGGWGIYNIGPIPEGLVTFFMGLLALVIVARLIGERTE